MKIAHNLTLYTQLEGSHTRTTSHMGMITNGLAEEHWHSIQATFYAILTKNGNYTCIFVGDTFGQSVSKIMTHLTVFGEFSSIPNLGKTSPPPPCTMLTRHEMTIVPERVINIDWGDGGKFGKHFFFSCGATFIKKIPKFCRVCHEFCNWLKVSIWKLNMHHCETTSTPLEKMKKWPLTEPLSHPPDWHQRNLRKGSISTM